MSDNIGNKNPQGTMVTDLSFCEPIPSYGRSILKMQLASTSELPSASAPALLNFQDYLVDNKKAGRQFKTIIPDAFLVFLDQLRGLSSSGSKNCRKVINKLTANLNGLLNDPINGLIIIDKMINPDKGGGVKAFFEFLFDFKSGDSIRSVWEAPAAAVQCANVYKKLELKTNSVSRGKQIKWVKNNTALESVTCYICEAELQSVKPNDGNAMQCEHFFPFLEAQLFWCLYLRSMIDKQTRNRTLDSFFNICKREYGPVCRTCNCNPFKGGKPILKYNSATGKWDINNDTIKSIVGGGGAAADRSRKKPIPILNAAQRKERLLNVFRPLKQAVNASLDGDPGQNLEQLLYKYFLYIDASCFNKLVKIFTKGEDLAKIQKARDSIIKSVKKAKKAINNTYKKFKSWINKSAKKEKRRGDLLKEAQKKQQDQEAYAASGVRVSSRKKKATTSLNIESEQEKLDQYKETQKQIIGMVKSYHQKMQQFLNDREGQEEQMLTDQQKDQLTKLSGNIKKLQKQQETIMSGGGYSVIFGEEEINDWDLFLDNMLISRESVSSSRRRDIILQGPVMQIEKKALIFGLRCADFIDKGIFTVQNVNPIFDKVNREIEKLKNSYLNNLWELLFDIFKNGEIKLSPSDVYNISMLKKIFLGIHKDSSTFIKYSIRQAKKLHYDTLSSIMLDWFSHFYINKNSSNDPRDAGNFSTASESKNSSPVVRGDDFRQRPTIKRKQKRKKKIGQKPGNSAEFNAGQLGRRARRKVKLTPRQQRQQQRKQQILQAYSDYSGGGKKTRRRRKNKKKTRRKNKRKRKTKRRIKKRKQTRRKR